MILEASPNLSPSSLNWPFTFSNLHWLEKWGIGDEKRHIPKKREERTGTGEKILFRASVSAAGYLSLSGVCTGDLESLLCCKSPADVLLNGTEIEVLMASSNQAE